MAKLSYEFPSIAKRLRELGENAREIIGEIEEEASEIVKDEYKKQLSAVIGSNTKRKSRSTGELIESVGGSKSDVSYQGVINVNVGMNEPRRVQAKTHKNEKRSYYKATNAMVANVLEYGKHGQEPRPFAEQVRKNTGNRVASLMQRRFKEKMKRVIE